MHQNYGFINQKLYGWKCECKYGAILINKNETQTSGEKAWEMSAASICSHYRIVSTLRRAKRNLCYGLCILYVFSTMYFRIKWAHMKSLLVVQSALKGWNWVIVAFLALSKMLFFFFFLIGNITGEVFVVFPLICLLYWDVGVRSGKIVLNVICNLTWVECKLLDSNAID